MKKFTTAKENIIKIIQGYLVLCFKATNLKLGTLNKVKSSWEENNVLKIEKKWWSN